MSNAFYVKIPPMLSSLFSALPLSLHRLQRLTFTMAALLLLGAILIGSLESCYAYGALDSTISVGDIASASGESGDNEPTLLPPARFADGAAFAAPPPSHGGVRLAHAVFAPAERPPSSS